jgi:hypothetical protein
MANMFINAMTDLWTNVGTTYTSIKMNVTNAASSATSKLIDLQVDSVSKFSADKNGAVSAASTISATGAFLPVVDDGATVGSTTFKVSDLYGASGFTINFNSGNWVAAHTSGILTVGTGDLRVTTAGTNAASVATVGGTQTLTGKTLTSPTINTPVIASGTFSGTSTFTGAISGTTGGFTGAVSMAGLTATTGTFSAAVSMAGLTATTGTFSGAVSGTTGTFSSAVSGTTGTFSGAVSGTTGTFSTSISTVGGNMVMAAGSGIRYHQFESNYYWEFNTTTKLLRWIRAGVEECHIGDSGITATATVYSEAGRFVATGVNGIFASTGTGNVNPVLAGALYLRPRGVDSTTFQTYIDANDGEFHIVSVSEYSDETLKKDFRPSIKALVNDIAALEIGSFKWIDTDTNGYGVKAQALLNIMPEVVHARKDGTLGVNYGKAAMAAVIDASKRILALEARLAELEGKV